MPTEKRMKIELRQITEQKRIAQQELSDLHIEVALLREERDTIRKEKEELRSTITTFQKEYEDIVQSARTELVRIEKQKQEFIETVSSLGVRITEHEKDLQHYQALLDTVQEDIARYNSELTAARSQYKEQKEKNNMLDEQLATAYKTLQSVGNELDTKSRQLTTLKEKILKEEQILKDILKEQARMNQWAEYLMEKENFVAEQFALLGVKFVRYNRE